MNDLLVEVPDKTDGKWAVAKLRCPHCGADRVHVYPAYLELIECECGQWFRTPLGNRRVSAVGRRN